MIRLFTRMLAHKCHTIVQRSAATIRVTLKCIFLQYNSMIYFTLATENENAAAERKNCRNYGKVFGLKMCHTAEQRGSDGK